MSAPELNEPVSPRPGRPGTGANAAGEWQRRFVAGPPELQDLTALYASLGYEVHAGPIAASDIKKECAGCKLALGLFRVIYTRRMM